MTKHSVYSTLSADTTYQLYDKSADGLPMPQDGTKVTIKGGANIANKHMITPQGIHTQVTDEQLASLQLNPVFKRHVDNGFIKVSKGEKDPNKVAEDMNPKDSSAPLTPDDPQYAADVPGAKPQGMRVKKD